MGAPAPKTLPLPLSTGNRNPSVILCFSWLRWHLWFSNRWHVSQTLEKLILLALSASRSRTTSPAWKKCPMDLRTFSGTEAAFGCNKTFCQLVWFLLGKLTPRASAHTSIHLFLFCLAALRRQAARGPLALMHPTLRRITAQAFLAWKCNWRFCFIFLGTFLYVAFCNRNVLTTPLKSCSKSLNTKQQGEVDQSEAQPSQRNQQLDRLQQRAIAAIAPNAPDATGAIWTRLTQHSHFPGMFANQQPNHQPNKTKQTTALQPKTTAHKVTSKLLVFFLFLDSSARSCLFFGAFCFPSSSWWVQLSFFVLFFLLFSSSSGGHYHIAWTLSRSEWSPPSPRWRQGHDGWSILLCQQSAKCLVWFCSFWRWILLQQRKRQRLGRWGQSSGCSKRCAMGWLPKSRPDDQGNCQRRRWLGVQHDGMGPCPIHC